MDLARSRNIRLLEFEFSGRAGLAKELGVDYKEIDKFFQRKIPAVPDFFAREAEAKLGKPHGWMDRDNSGLALNEDEWILLTKFRGASERDKVIILSVANAISPEK